MWEFDLFVLYLITLGIGFLIGELATMHALYKAFNLLIDYVRERSFIEDALRRDAITHVASADVDGETDV